MKQIFVAMILTVTLICTVVTSSHSAVDLRWMPEFKVVHTGDLVDIGLYAVADSQSSVTISALESIIFYDHNHLDFYDLINNDQPYNWLIDGFLSPSPDNLNLALDDGQMFYSAWAQLGRGAVVTNRGMQVTKLRFIASSPVSRTYLTIPAAFGSAAKTRVFDGTIPNLDIKGFLGSAKIMIVPQGYITSVAQAKQIADGVSFDIAGPIVTRKFDNYFYIEDYDRTAGIRVDCDPSELADEETTPIISGSLQTIDGERVLVATAVTPGDYLRCPRPIVITTRALSGGLSPQGLLVRIVGKVVSTSETTGTFIMSDGSGFDVRIELNGASMPSKDELVQVTGTVGAGLMGTIIRTNSEGISPL